jgi:hypothetical protein
MKTKTTPLNKKPFKARFKTLDDVRRFLGRLINEVRRGEADPQTASKLGYLSNILASTIKDSSLEARLDELEKKIRGDNK